MKVIFLEDVPRVARAGETKEVADGYGRNFLLPKKLAVLADSQASAVVEAQLKKREKLLAQTEAEMVELAGKLNGVEITLKAKAGAKERLYGSITSADIADELSRSTGLVVDKRKIELVEPIHQLGSYDVNVRFTHDIAAVLKLTVVAEEVAEEKVEKKEEAKAGKGEEEVAVEKEEKKEEAKAGKGEEEVAVEEEEKKEKVKAEKGEKKGKVKAEKEVKKGKVKEEKEKAKAGKEKTKAEKEEKKGKAKTEKKGKGKAGEKVEDGGGKEAK